MQSLFQWYLILRPESPIIFMNRTIPLLLIVFLSASCTTSGPKLFKKQSPHEQYAARIESAGLRNTTLGRLWFAAADAGMLGLSTIKLPFRETGYFPADNPEASGWRFSAKRGEKLSIQLTKKPLSDFILYLELFEVPEKSGDRPKLLVSADTSGRMDFYEVKKDAQYILRLQPELLRGGEYTITIGNGPSIAYPLQTTGNNHIQSFWGDARDRGTRKHEGIDLFAPFRTPVVAAANGFITRVQETEIGGKVIWLRPSEKDYSLYYAHLDSQTVQEGSQVKTGDIIGLMGTTGNARNTAPHLHFGIYGRGGAIDPFPFVNPEVKSPLPVKGNVKLLDKWIRQEGVPGKLYFAPDIKESNIPIQPNTVFKNKAAIANWYRVMLPDGTTGFILIDKSNSLTVPLRQLKLNVETAIFDNPDTLAARKTIFPAGAMLDVLGNWKEFYYVKNENNLYGWIKKKN